MIFGHIGVALAAKSWRREAPLVLLFTAAIAPDLLDGVYTFAQFCNPFGAYSHSLVAIAALAGAFALLSLALTRNPSVAGAIVLVTLAHVPADYLTGAKLAWSYGPVIGLFLYRWPLVDFAIELPLIVAGWWLFRRSTAAPRWMGGYEALAVLVVAQGLFDVGTNIRKAVERNERHVSCEEAYLRQAAAHASLPH